MFALVLAVLIVQLPATAEECRDIYVLKAKVNVRSGPEAGSDKLGTLPCNTSLTCLGDENGWMHTLDPSGSKGWVRNDMLSGTVIRIHKNDRKLVVSEHGQQVFVTDLTPGPRYLGAGRYFLSPAGGVLAISWPNRHDLRKALQSGRMKYQTYKQAILTGNEHMTESQLALCPSGNNKPICGALLDKADYKRLAALVPYGARIEVYTNINEDKQLNRPDEFSRLILEGARKQLRHPAMGLRPGGRTPSLSYPGGDIQPDFASSSDIVIRAVRYAGVDLQALVHEDIILHPKRYADMDLGDDHAAAHRRIPILKTFLDNNAISLSTNQVNHPFSFEAGDIVAFADVDDEQAPSMLGIVSETFNRTGLPLIITIGGRGQSTGRKDVLGRRNHKVTGHYRMTHPFDYQ